jgi:hypothetical protein
MALCSDPECEKHYSCRMRRKGVNFGMTVKPAPDRARSQHRPNTSWEAGKVYDPRPGGLHMPILAPGKRTPLHVKEYGEKRRDIDEQIRRLKTTTTPLKEAT